MVNLTNVMLIFIAAVALAIGVIGLVRKVDPVSCPDPTQPDSGDCVPAWKAGAIPYGVRPEKFRNTRKRKERFSQSEYTKVWGFNDEAGYRKSMVINNPFAAGKDNGDADASDWIGGDPTHSRSYYAFGMVNKDNWWEPIPDDYSLVSTTDDGLIKISIDDEWREYNGSDKTTVGAPRHTSTRATLGGIFIADVVQMPTGCGMWPALWQNGYVGLADQIYQTDPTTIQRYMDDLPNLSGEFYCPGPPDGLDKDSAGVQRGGKSFWPMAGEVDIFEQTNFSQSGLVSLHGGQWSVLKPTSETTQSAGNMYQQNFGWWGSWNDTATRGDDSGANYADAGMRPQCGGDFCYSDGVGSNFSSGCGDTEVGSGGWYRCPCAAATNSGTSQTVARRGTFGPTFNNNGGGVVACVWVPFETYKIYWFTGLGIPREQLELEGGPLSASPDPSTWSDNYLLADWSFPTAEDMPEGYPTAGVPTRNMSFQYVVLNTAVGGDWAAGTPDYCTVDEQKPDGNEWLKDCFYADPADADERGYAVDSNSGKSCNDGGMPSYGPGNFGKPVDPAYQPWNKSGGSDVYDVNPLRRPVFVKESYWLVKSMSLYVNPDTDQVLDTSLPCVDGEVCGLVDPKDW
jgi:hypothetical protein